MSKSMSMRARTVHGHERKDSYPGVEVRSQRAKLVLRDQTGRDARVAKGKSHAVARLGAAKQPIEAAVRAKGRWVEQVLQIRSEHARIRV